ncbi:MAG: HsdR family type I site-specific deoxyribonuclease [Tissierellia bacterium]|nr:HsdR family type I site-specific deoxyribonuclease [Tissierellia bacterium]
MVFEKELDFEKALINILSTKGWEKEVIKNPSEEDLINNWSNILFNNNRDRDRLNDYPLTNGEMSQILEQINSLKTPLKLNGFINGKTVSIKRDNPDDKEHYGKEISLKIYDRDEIAAGQSRYQIAQQPKFKPLDEIANKRRGDLMLLINGMPVIHIELKRSGVSVADASTQIEKYSSEGVFTGLFSLIQIFVAMTPDETIYFSNPGTGVKFNRNFYFHWQDFNNTLINNWKNVASSLLSIPMAHQLIGFYTVADDSDGALKVMRSYQYYAANAISDKVSKTDFDDDNLLGGYIWHTTGSGKTMTSFKSAQLIANSKDADKVVFLMDRIELGIQSLREFRSFADENESVQQTENTDVLITKLKSDNPKDTLIVTSIQKMSRIKDENGMKESDIQVINSKRLVFIVDECHRDVFGEMMITIKNTFPRAIFFGFTGTPILDENLKKGISTSEVFGNELHRYSIADGIRDKNVLGFDPYKVSTFRDIDLRKKVALEKARASSEDEIYKDNKKIEVYNKYMEQIKMYDEEDGNGNLTHGIEYYIPISQYQSEVHHKAVISNILENYARISRNYKFSAILATSSIHEAIEYYNLFKENEDSNLKLTCLFDPNIDNNDGFQFKEQGLLEIIKDYNKQYDQTFNMSTFPKMKQDIVARFAHKKPYTFIKEEEKIDLLIVVDQMLTGFDSKWINTLYLDKVLKYENIIQAFSRTNRVFGIDKPHGIIKYYRYPNTMEQNIKKAVKLYSGDKPFGIFVDKLEENTKKLNVIYNEIKKLFESNEINNFEKLPDNKVDKRKFATLFKNFKNVLDCARIQGLVLENSDKLNNVDKIESNAHQTFKRELLMISEKDTPYELVKSPLDFTEDEVNKLVQRGNDLSKTRTNGADDNTSYDIEAYITEYDIEKIDSEYLNSKFEKYLKDLSQSSITPEELEKSLSELNCAFAYLSSEQQKYANIFIRDIESKNVEIVSGKSFIDYITEYQNRAKNDSISELSNNLGLNEQLLRRMTALNLNEKNINELGRFNELIASVELNKAKEYFEVKENKKISMFMVNYMVDELLRNFILNQDN